MRWLCGICGLLATGYVSAQEPTPLAPIAPTIGRESGELPPRSNALLFYTPRSSSRNPGGPGWPSQCPCHSTLSDGSADEMDAELFALVYPGNYP